MYGQCTAKFPNRKSDLYNTRKVLGKNVKEISQIDCQVYSLVAHVYMLKDSSHDFPIWIRCAVSLTIEEIPQEKWYALIIPGWKVGKFNQTLYKRKSVTISVWLPVQRSTICMHIHLKFAQTLHCFSPAQLMTLPHPPLKQPQPNFILKQHCVWCVHIVPIKMKWSITCFNPCTALILMLPGTLTKYPSK